MLSMLTIEFYDADHVVKEMAQGVDCSESILTQNLQNSRKRVFSESLLSPPPSCPKESKQLNVDKNMDTSGRVKLHIGNVPYEMKWQELKDLLRDRVGTDVYVEIFNGPDGRPSGVGVIEVNSAELAKKTINVMHRADIRGRQIIVREENEEDVIRRIHFGSNARLSQGAPPGGRPATGMGPVSQLSTQSLSVLGNAGSISNDFSMQLLHELGIDPANITNQVFVANLDYKVSADKLEEIFRIAGNVLNVELKMDKESNKFRGMATVRYEHPVESVQAISLFHGQRLFSRAMSVRLDRWNDVRPQTAPRMLPSGLESIGMGLGLGGQPLQNIGQIANSLSLQHLGTFLRNKASAAAGGSMGMGAPSGSRSVAGVPAVNPALVGAGSGLDASSAGGLSNLETIIAATVRAVTGQLSGLEGSTDASLLRRNPNPSGLPALEMGGAGTRWSGPSVVGADGVWGGVDGGRRMGSAGMPSADAVRSGLLGSDNDANTLYVGNLPYAFTWQGLKDKFKEVGDVLFADIKSENGRPAGYGTVRFKNPDDAVKAIAALNGCIIEGRPIEVRWLNKPSTASLPGY